MRHISAFTIVLLTLTATAASSEEHKFVPTTFHTTFSSAHPAALKVKSGDKVITSVLDDVGHGQADAPAAEMLNPQTGPFFIEGAEPGDLLVVSIEKLTPNRTTGYSTATMTANSIDPMSITSRPDQRRYPWTLDDAGGVVRLDLGVFRGVDWKSRYANPFIELPLQPALGSIGVAPSQAVGSDVAGSFGGNMMSAAASAGTRVMLHVNQPGALLYLGRGLANAGDGIVTGTGIETSLDVEFSVEVVKKKEWPHSSDVRPSTVVGEFPQGWPRLESATHLTTIGTAPTLLEALQHATIELHHWLDDDFGLNERAVSLLVGQGIEYEIGRIGESSFTVAAKVRKTYLPK